jgi:hypothetical protein
MYTVYTYKCMVLANPTCLMQADATRISVWQCRVHTSTLHKRLLGIWSLRAVMCAWRECIRFVTQ